MPLTARAAVVREANAPLHIEDLTLADAGYYDVTIRMTVSDVCGRDASVIAGGPEARVDVVLGHEGVGVVEAIGRGVSRVKVGDTVVLKNSPGRGCGTCFYCTRSQSIYCESPSELPAQDRFVGGDGNPVAAYLDLGTLAGMIVTSQTAVIPIDTGLPHEQLALFGCPIRAAFWAVMNTAQVKPGASVAVIGTGPVGLSVIQAAKIAGATEILAVDPALQRRTASMSMGATTAINPDAIDVVDGIRELTGGRGADFVFEAVRKPETYLQAISASRRGGTTVLMGIPTANMTVTIPSNTLAMTGRRILGSHAGDYNLEAELRRYARFVESGQLDSAALVTRTFGIEDVNKVFDDLGDINIIRSLVVFD